MLGTGSSIAYAASKAALDTMSFSLARALGPEMRVNAVAPGYVRHALAGRTRTAPAGAERACERKFAERVPLKDCARSRRTWPRRSSG